ncbi:MAG: lipoate--protein ligase family protein [Promethearchaeota archaeon]
MTKPVGRVLDSETTNPAYNLALEEAILSCHQESKTGLTIRFWRNEKCVILGRNQSVSTEVNVEFCNQNHVKLFRRLSGGGAVYQDMGNLNVSFFVPKRVVPFSSIDRINYFFTNIILKSLNKLGIKNLEIKDNSNIFWNGLKVSGGAGLHHKNFILHHATLLINADLDLLEKCLLAGTLKSKEKTTSKYSHTANLAILEENKWKQLVISRVASIFQVQMEVLPLYTCEEKTAALLERDKYSVKNWTWKRA